MVVVVVVVVGVDVAFGAVVVMVVVMVVVVVVMVVVVVVWWWLWCWCCYSFDFISSHLVLRSLSIKPRYHWIPPSTSDEFTLSCTQAASARTTAMGFSSAILIGQPFLFMDPA